jgi:hypothetical protein
MSSSAQDVWVSIQSKPHGSSGRGVSYYRAWNGACSKRAFLDNKRAEEGFERINRTDARGFSYFDVGVYYHLLHEIAARGQLPNEAWDVDEALDVNFILAVRLYQGWKKAFGTIADKYGCSVIGAEIALPETTMGKEQTRRLLGGDLTGRADLIIQVEDPELARHNTATEHSPGLTIPKGVYILDFKTAGKFSEGDYFKYQRDLQARAYLTLYNLEHKDRPAKGMIFDQLVKHTKLSRVPVYAGSKVKQHSSFHAYVQMVGAEDVPVLTAMVQNGLRNIANPKPNPTACIGMFDVCPHLLSGECRGH